MPSWVHLNFQDSCSPSMSELSYLHDHVMTIMFSIIILISYIMGYLLVNNKTYKFLSEGTLIETIWSMIPALLLIILVIPSMKILYLVEDIKSPSYSFKIIAHQWYWSYMVPFFNNMNFKMSNNFENDSVMNSELNTVPRLLECSYDLFVPVNVSSRFLISSTDVIHSFTIPSMGLKVDAMPGRINQLFSNPSRLGSFYGQCSEICGSNHSFMPISMKVISDLDFKKISLIMMISNLLE